MSTKFEEAADAVVSGDIDTLTRLLDENPALSHERSTREHRCTLLHYVGANGFEGFRQKSPKNAVEIAELLLERGAAVAAEYGRRDVVDFMLDKGVDLAASANTGQTALHLAAHRGQLDIIKLLIDRGAPLEVFNCYGGTVMGQALWSAENGEPDIDFVPVIEMLLAAGAQPDVYPGMKERIEKILGRPI